MAPAYLKKASSANSNSSLKFSDQLQTLAGCLECKFKGGAFSTWSDVFVRLNGRWLTMHKRERDSSRIAAVELGPGVEVTDLNDLESSQKFPRRFDVTCKGGLLPATEFIFRTKSRKERDQWVLAIATNTHLLDTVGLEMNYGLNDLEQVTTRLKEALNLTPIRIRSNLSVRCASGEDIVAFLVAEELASDRVHANAIAQRLLSMNFIHHVVWEKDFVDSMEQYAITELEDDSNYVVEHFQKYMDTRKFWKFFDNDGSSSAGSSARQNRSTASSGGSSSVSARTSTMSAAESAKQLAAATAQQAAEKKAKKCTVCNKSFNPLRRRYSCRTCSAVVCSHCSMSRKIDSANEGVVTARICVSCKLSTMSAQDDFYDRIFSGPSTNSVGSSSELSHSHSHSGASSSTSGGRFSTFSSTGTTATNGSLSSNDRTASGSTLNTRRSNASQNSRRDSFNATSISGLADCLSCMNEACAPLNDFFEIPYPVSEEQMDPTGRNQFIAALDLGNEAERMRSVRAIQHALDTTNLSQLLLQMCSMAAIASSCPMGIIGLLDSDEFIICGKYGVSTKHVIARELSLAAHTCRTGKPLVCSDLATDVRFIGNPWRRDALQASFYAGIPLQLSNGHIVGTLEVYDNNVRYGCVEVVDHLQTVVRGLVKKLDEVVASTPAEVLEGPSSAPAQVTPVVEAPTSTGAAVAPVQAAPVSAPSASTQQPPQNEMESRLMELLSQTTSTQEQLRNQQGQMVTAISSHTKQISELAKQLERMESTLNSKLDAKENSTQDSSSPTS
ncbi:TPA: hypothetical protein N0F65_003564 [Lagenidium giganteum]|uniref:FYVE-type domain-containing protein n=1 Tax=Lagenidium giganteum TaxID=4803 RepID=A0AAV2Z7L3_9STRA|nr:TPA: hypothetical protein N0F65_003564 [Lagenidium giganteum]